MSEFESAVQFIKLGEFKKAEQILRRAVASDGANFDALHMLGVVCSELGQFDDAERSFEAALNIDSRYPPLHQNYGLLLSKTKRFQEAVQRFDIAIQLAPNFPPVYSGRGNALKELGKLDEAVADHNRAIALAPQFFGFYNNRGNALAAQRQYSEALSDFDRAISLKPDFADAYCGRASALSALNRLDQALAAYDKALAINPDLDNAWLARGEVLAVLGRHGEAVASYDRALAINPGLEAAWLGRGNGLSAFDRHDEALAAYDKALSINPDLAIAWLGRGHACRQLQRSDEAFAAYDRAQSIEPNMAGAWLGRANLLSDLKRYDEAFAAYDTAQSMAPDAPAIHASRGHLLHILARNQEALECFDQAVRLDPENPLTHLSRSTVLLTLGRFAEGWTEYEWRKRTVRKDGARPYPQPPLSDLDDIKDATVLLFGEQGFGDQIQFCRYAKLLSDRGAKVLLNVDRPLVQLFKSLDKVQIVEPDQLPPRFDYHCPLMSLPLVFATTLNNVPREVPYLFAEPEKSKKWASRLGNKSKLRVGLAWSVGFRPDRPESWVADRKRSIPLAKFACFRDLDAEFYSLQIGEPGRGEFSQLRSGGWDGPRIIDVSDAINDFSDTAALVDNLDLVISVDTSTAHLTGALGKPVWVLNRFDIDWRWLPDSPWYPTARLYRQKQPGDWDGVIETVKANLVRATSGASVMPARATPARRSAG